MRVRLSLIVILFAFSFLGPASTGQPGAQPAVSAAQKMRAHFIDVGQGAATLLDFPCAAVLIDTGTLGPEPGFHPLKLPEAHPRMDRALCALLILPSSAA